MQGFDGTTTRTFLTADYGGNALTITPATTVSGLLTLSAGLTVSGGSISASGIAADEFAQRRGIADADEARRNGKDANNLAPGFRISGLGQLIEGGIQADRLVVFGD